MGWGFLKKGLCSGWSFFEEKLSNFGDSQTLSPPSSWNYRKMLNVSLILSSVFMPAQAQPSNDFSSLCRSHDHSRPAHTSTAENTLWMWGVFFFIFCLPLAALHANCQMKYSHSAPKHVSMAFAVNAIFRNGHYMMTSSPSWFTPPRSHSLRCRTVLERHS